MFTRSVKILQFFSSAVDRDTERAAAAIIIATISKRKRGRKQRSTLVKPWVQKRLQLSMFNTFLREFRKQEKDEYK